MHQADVHPSEVDLTAKAVASRMGEGVVVVVPAFAEGQRCNPGVIAGAITAVVGRIPPVVGR